MVQNLILLRSNINMESLVIAIAGYLIVFTALVVLFWFFNLTPKLIALGKTKIRIRQGKHPLPKEGKGISGEEIAAISMALHLYLDEMHDQESGVLTIKQISRAYSPWSSKIYAVRNQFNRL
jgi:hypothetical protein